MTLFQDLGNIPLTVIRFNPDKYIINNPLKAKLKTGFQLSAF